MQIICSPHQKKYFSIILGSFWKIEFLKENIFWQIICSPHQKKCFSTILGSFCKIEFWRKFNGRKPYKNSEIFVLSEIVLRKYFFANYLFPSSKEVFLHNFRQFLWNWIFDGNSTGADLTKIVKFLCYLQ